MNGNDDEFYLFSNVVIKESQLGNTLDGNITSNKSDSDSLPGNPLITSNDMNSSLVVHSKEEKQNKNIQNNKTCEKDSNIVEDANITTENSQISSKKKKRKNRKKKKNENVNLEKNSEEEKVETITEVTETENSEKKKRKLPTESSETIETTNPKKKRKKNKKDKNTQKTEEEKEEGEEINENNTGTEDTEQIEKNKSNKSNFKIVKNNRQSFFVGQIPYDCKEDQIRKHFEKNGIEVKDIRMLTKDDGSFKGCCFLHVPAVQKEKTAKLHHSFLNNRQINVTLDPKSLGLTSKTSKDIMKTTIKKIRNDADKTTEEIMSETLQNIMNKANGSVTANDIDKKSLTALCSLPNNLSERLINDFSRLNFAGVKNINAYLMGMIKKYRTKYIPLSKKK